MARRMIDPQMIIKSQIVDDKFEVDLYEILEKYGTLVDPEFSEVKAITLQIYSKFFYDDENLQITDDSGAKASILPNTTITMTQDGGYITIAGCLVDNFNDMNLMFFVDFLDGTYENGIRLESFYPVDVHVIRV